MLGEREEAMRMASGGRNVFMEALWSTVAVGWFLLGLLCCRTNDRMSIFLLPVVVHAKERKEEG